MQRRLRETVSEKSRHFSVAGRSFDLRASDVERSMRGVLPEPLRDHYVVIAQRRYPPKQVLGRVTGLDRADFTTHHARRILTRLGFPAGRRPSVTSLDLTESTRPANDEMILNPSAETLEPFIGQWVATKGTEVLVAAPDPYAVVAWLSEHGVNADGMFRVPANEFEIRGGSPPS